MQSQLGEIVTEVGRAINSKKDLLSDGGSWEGSQLKTKADIFAHNALVSSLEKLERLPIVSEEDSNSHFDFRPDKYWIIDPIDGTRSFADGYSGWVTQVAMIEGGNVKHAAIYAPDLDLLYLATRDHGACCNGRSLMVSRKNIDKIRLIDNYPEPRGIAKFLMKKVPCNEYIESGSIALKICRIADGSADLFVKDVTVRDWDVAAPMLILHESGGMLTDVSGNSYLLHENFNKSGLIVSSSQELIEKSLIVMDDIKTL